jgi:hypothetical protein
MDACDLTPTQADVLHARIDSMRRFVDRLLTRMHAQGFPETDLLRVAAARALVEINELVLVTNDLRDKGKAHLTLKRAKHWGKG